MSHHHSKNSPDPADPPQGGIGALLRGDPSSRNIELIARIEKESLQRRNLPERIGDTIAKHFGTMTVFIVHVLWFGIWIAINRGWMPGIKPFDPFPYGLLTMIVSLEAIFVSIVLLISQNRMTRQADHRAQLNLQIDMLEEEEMTRVLKILCGISQHLGVKEQALEDEPQETEHLMQKTDVRKMAKDLESKLPA
ncbi:MAG: DUF1003 domain-containing protein [Candidatus Sumerlaeaceae bacterium]